MDEPAGEHRLLLVPARERADRALDARGTELQGVGLLLGGATLGALVEQSSPCEAGERRQRDVAVDRLVEQEPLALALLGREPDPGVHRGGHGARAQPLGVDGDRAGGRASRAVDRLDDLRAPRAHETGETDDLPRAHLERHVLEHAAQAQSLDVQHDGCVVRGLGGLGEDVLDGAARHEGDELLRRGLGDREVLRDGAAVLEHGDAVADLADLLEAVRDVHDRDARLGQLLDDAEEVAHLLGVQHGRRLVHDDDAGVVRQGTRHRDDLLAGRGQVPDLLGGRDLRVAEPPEDLPCATHGLAPLGEPRGGELVPEVDVLGDGEAVDDVELLVHRRDAVPQGGDGVGDGDGLAVEEDLPLGGLVRPGEHLDERGLAGAVLPEEAVDLAGEDLEVDAVDGGHLASSGAVDLAEFFDLDHRESTRADRRRRWAAVRADEACGGCRSGTNGAARHAGVRARASRLLRTDARPARSGETGRVRGVAQQVAFDDHA